MARTTKVLGFSVPPEVAQEFEDVAQSEKRSKSELFREMFRVYRQYRARKIEFDDAWIRNVVREVKAQPMTPEELEAESKALAEYGEQRAKELGYDTLTDDDIVRIIHEYRAEQRT